MAGLRIGFDIGGTFTDLVLYDEASGRIHSHKLATTARSPEAAVRAGWRTLLAETGFSAAQVSNAIHGTTLITNCLVERKGAVTLLLATQGFGDVLDTQREMRYDIYDLHAPQVEHLVPRPLRFEARERMDAFGGVIEELSLDSLGDIARRLERAGVTDSVESIAVCFLHAFTNPEHERKAGAWLSKHLPELRVSLSHEVAPEIREYERMSTTVCNAYVQPLAATYLRQLGEVLREVGFEREMFLMLSSGGVSTLETAAKFPIRLVESGPAAGALAAVFYGELLDLPDLVSFDMGGTTAKMCLIKDGQPAMSDHFEIARVHRFKRGSGLPVRVPAIDVETRFGLGAAGSAVGQGDSPDLASAEALADRLKLGQFRT
jgi:N-methylhydantoinase A